MALVACTPAVLPAPTAAPAKPAETKPQRPLLPPGRRQPLLRGCRVAGRVACRCCVTAACRAGASPPRRREAAAPPGTAPPPAAPAEGHATGSIVIALNDETPTMEMWQAYSTYGYPILRNTNEGLVNQSGEQPARRRACHQVGDDHPDHLALLPASERQVPRRDAVQRRGGGLQPQRTWSKEQNFRIRTFIGPEFQAKAVEELVLDVETVTPDPILPERLYFSPSTR